jgi:hypothetical protein
MPARMIGRLNAEQLRALLLRLKLVAGFQHPLRVSRLIAAATWRGGDSPVCAGRLAWGLRRTRFC